MENYYCARCGGKLNALDTADKSLWAVGCSGCFSAMLVSASSKEEALQTIGMTKDKFTLCWYRNVRTKLTAGE